MVLGRTARVEAEQGPRSGPGEMEQERTEEARREESGGEKGGHPRERAIGKGTEKGRKGARRERSVRSRGAIRCLEPRVVASHLLGVKNSKLRVDMGLCLHRLQPTTGLRGTDVPVIPAALLLYISRFSPVAPCINCRFVRDEKNEGRDGSERKKKGGRLIVGIGTRGGPEPCLNVQREINRGIFRAPLFNPLLINKHRAARVN